MKRDNIALLEKFLLVGYRTCASSLDDIGGTIGVLGIYLHAKALGDTGHIAPHIPEGEQAKLLAFQL